MRCADRSPERIVTIPPITAVHPKPPLRAGRESLNPTPYTLTRRRFGCSQWVHLEQLVLDPHCAQDARTQLAARMFDRCCAVPVRSPSGGLRGIVTAVIVLYSCRGEAGQVGLIPKPLDPVRVLWTASSSPVATKT